MKQLSLFIVLCGLIGPSYLVDAAEVEMTFGMPASLIGISSRDANDQVASSSGLLLGLDVISSKGDIAGTAISQSAIGPEDALVLSSTAFGLTWAIDKLYKANRTDSAGVSIAFRPSYFQTLGVLISRSRFDLSQSKKLPQDAIFVDDEPIVSGSYLAMHLRYGYHRKLSTQFLSTHVFYESSLSSPGQKIRVTSMGISVSMRMNIFSAI